MTTAERPIPRGGVLDINAYVPGRSEAPGAAKVFKLSSNETPLGPSPKAVAAFRAAGDSLAYYPDGAATALREAIGKAFGLDPARIVCGTGSDELLNLLAQTEQIEPGRAGLGQCGNQLVHQLDAGGFVARSPLVGKIERPARGSRFLVAWMVTHAVDLHCRPDVNAIV